MKLRPGDLVTIALWDSPSPKSTVGKSGISLARAPFDPAALTGNDVVSTLWHHELAVVIALSDSSGTCVYVLGPECMGWAFGAYLKRV